LDNSSNITEQRLSPYLSPVAAWALSIGTAIGWGSLVVMNSSYLSQGGPLGSIIGLVICAVLMIVMCRNFHFMANRYPDAGGIYAYTKNIFGYDRAFLVAWFLSLTYLSIFWANATSLPLFARYFIGDTFRFGYLFRVFGYEVYFGEALLTLVSIALVTLLCIKSKNAAAHVMVVLAIIVCAGIVGCFAAAMIGHGRAGFSFEPGFIPGKPVFPQIVRIAFISPWAFIGFEGITHSSEEFRFPHDRLFRILTVSVISTTALYIFVSLLSISAYPGDAANWMDYITNLGRYSGIEGLPAFYAARYYLGETGVALLMAALLALILTSLIGNLRAISRLFYAVARDGILPERFAELNDKQIPAKAMLLVASISLFVPFIGRTAIGWIVDVTTIGATLVYGFVSATTFKLARNEHRTREQITGLIGLVVMLVFAFYLLFPNFFSDDTLETETYILLIGWSILGFFYFQQIIKRDHARRFGKAIVVWVALLALIVVLAMIWSGREEARITADTIHTIQNYYNGTADPSILAMEEDPFIEKQLADLNRSTIYNTALVVGLFALALAAMLINHFSMQRWEAKTAKERDAARDVAYKDSLTGVKSKHAYVEAERDIAQQIYDGTVDPFAIVVCDVNGLKHINDTLGHKAGDTYICSASDLICDYFKRSPVFRIGGDEFAIILQGQDYENRHTILAALNEQIERNLGTNKVVASLGMAHYRRNEDNTFHAVFTRADGRMYERKKQLKSMGAITRD